jgi:dTDP-4-amino-4,6-dideoxygalactose transaminase
MKEIQVTQPFLPPIEEYIKRLHGIWDRNWLTNAGPLVKELEQKLQDHHSLNQPVYCVANGGLGLQIILKALGIRGEVITTPFSYVATTSCPLWEGCTIRYADIDPTYLTLDPRAAEAAITSNTKAILATHVYGNPCDVEAFEQIGKKYGIAIIYDAAHAFGVTYKRRSLLEWGDASMVSMHATKVFHSVEGGFICARDPEVSRKMEWMRRFGHNGPGAYHGAGINAKLSEFHAAMGLCVFDHLEEILTGRRLQCEAYDRILQAAKQITSLDWRANTSRNYAYYPVLFESEEALLQTTQKLEVEGVFCRRYFHPSLEQVPTLGSHPQDCPVSLSVSKRVLCLPLAAENDPCVADCIRALAS